jgi:phospholipid transport system substrate-binding protein
VPGHSFAGEATDQIKQTVDAVVGILNNKDLKKPDKKEIKAKKIREIVNKRFDFEEMAKRSLATHWAKRTPAEKKEFVSLYSDLLENTYIKKVERYEDEKVIYLSEKVDGNYAVIKTNIIYAQELQIPVDYKISKQNGRWGVYDIVIEGVSLVNNYRTQFNQIISSKSYEELIKKLRDKNPKGPM